MQARTPGLVIRPAEADDGPRLLALERDSSVPAGRGVSFTLDKLNALALRRPRSEAVVLVAEIGGRIVALHSASIHDGLLGGHRRRLAWLHYPRVVPEHRGKWIGHSLQAELNAVCQPRVDHRYQLFWSGRDAADGWHCWRTHPVYLLLDTHRVGGPGHGRPATPDDAELIVEMLNAAHGHDELFLPHSVASLAAYLERSPAEYSWADLVIGDGAVVGMWRGGWRVVRNHISHQVTGVLDSVLDYGYLPGAEGELLRLLRAACGQREHGPVEGYLGMWSSAGSPAYAVLAALAGRETLFDLHADVPEPAGSGHKGVHLDALQCT